MNRIVIESSTCKKCQICVEICPNKVLQMDQAGHITTHPQKIAACFACGQCMAVCPTQAITVNELSYAKDFFEFPANEIDSHEFYHLIATRRSIRNFQERLVEKELLEKIVQAIALAPPGFPPIKYELIVVQDAQLIKRALPYMIDLYEFLVQVMSNPLKRQFVRKELGKVRYRTLQHHLIPLLKMRLPALKDGTENTITRDAQALILFLADRTGEDIAEDIHIAATYGMLAAHSLGLGATIMDLIPPAINKKPELRELFHVSDNRDVLASIILGYPKYKYQRGIKRAIPNIIWL